MAYIGSSTCGFCCGAMEIGGFGGGESWQDEGDEFQTSKQLLKEIKDILIMAKRQGFSLVFATTMSNQPKAAEALSNLGFYTSKPFNKIKSRNSGDERKMQAWFLPLVEFKG